MDEEIERLVVSVRADTAGFARDVAAMQNSLEGPFASGVDRAGRALETTLVRAVRSGSMGFEDLGRIANQVLGEIAAGAMRSRLDTLLGGAASGGGLLGSLLGLVSGGPRAARSVRSGPIGSASAGRNCSCPPAAAALWHHSPAAGGTCGSRSLSTPGRETPRARLPNRAGRSRAR